MSVVPSPAIGLWQRLRGPWPIEVTRHTLHLSAWPAENGGLRIAVMGDFHCSPWAGPETVERAVAVCDRQRPDIVLLTGDFISHSATYAGPCAAALKGLQARFGVYAVPGNHDHMLGWAIVRSAMQSAGVQWLVNRRVEPVAGLQLVGLDDLWTGRVDVESVWTGIAEESAVLVLAHNPRAASLVAQRDCVFIAGHTHGGQFSLHPRFRLRPPDILVRGLPYVAGWHRCGRARVYVNRGIGVVLPPIRWHAAPEVTVLNLG